MEMQMSQVSILFFERLFCDKSLLLFLEKSSAATAWISKGNPHSAHRIKSGAGSSSR
jgi:hypothetical protein